jgi:hypothetical protein
VGELLFFSFLKVEFVLKAFLRLSLGLCISSMFLSCSSTPVIPEGKNVTVSRDEAKKSCQELGRVTGRTITAKPNLEAAVEDMKKEAALKGANYIRMETASGLQSAVAGTAYFCQ